MSKFLAYAIVLCSMTSSVSAYVETDYDSPIHRAVREGRYEKAEVILKIMPLAVNKKAAYEQRPLHIAVRKNNLRCAELLLTYEADVDVQDKHKQTALHVAASLGNLKAIQLLLAAGASTSILDENKLTASGLALKKGYDDVALLLDA